MPRENVYELTVRRTGDRVALPAGKHSCPKLLADIRAIGSANFAAEYFLDDCMRFDLYVPIGVIAETVEVMVSGASVSVCAEFLARLKVEGFEPLPHAAGPLLRAIRRDFPYAPVVVVTASQGSRFILWKLGQTRERKPTFMVVNNDPFRGKVTLALQRLGWAAR